MTRPWLVPFTPLYAAATAARNFAFDRKILSTRTLPRPVASVGNLAAGGSGKTPLVIALTRLLQSAGRVPVVLSRGYGRKSTAITRVTASSTFAEAGDEPLVIHRSTGAEVWVGADRHAAGLAAFEHLRHNPQIIFVLDDGYQHRQLHRQLNVCMVSRADLTDSLLPGGNLREPLSALDRADILAFADADAETFPDFRKRFSGASCTRPAVWVYESQTDTAAISGKTVFAFCAIARPERFFSAIEPGLLAGTRAYRDHHAFTDDEIASLIEECRATNAQAIVTTEKDAARLSPAQQNMLERCAPLYTLPLHLNLDDPHLCLQQMLAVLDQESPVAR